MAAPSGAGLVQKYEVHRLNDEAGKHDDCRFFVLDPQHDAIARYALASYAYEADRTGNKRLADDILAWLGEIDDAYWHERDRARYFK